MLDANFWQDKSLAQRVVKEKKLYENLINSYANSIKKLDELGVQIHKWSPEMIALFEEKWLEVVEEESEKNEEFSRVWNSVKKFRTSYARWRDLGYLK